ncbi:hypothetical protein DFH09DRAFT_1073336 [Mycena vulgaris]|nr:hypothetical protein DFH09DRAFT_1073336 [Mycena vulgaris]
MIKFLHSYDATRHANDANLDEQQHKSTTYWNCIHSTAQEGSLKRAECGGASVPSRSGPDCAEMNTPRSIASSHTPYGRVATAGVFNHPEFHTLHTKYPPFSQQKYRDLHANIHHKELNRLNREFAQEPLEPFDGRFAVCKWVAPPAKMTLDSSTEPLVVNYAVWSHPVAHCQKAIKWLQWLLRKLANMRPRPLPIPPWRPAAPRSSLAAAMIPGSKLLVEESGISDAGDLSFAAVAEGLGERGRGGGPDLGGGFVRNRGRCTRADGCVRGSMEDGDAGEGGCGWRGTRTRGRGPRAVWEGVGEGASEVEAAVHEHARMTKHLYTFEGAFEEAERSTKLSRRDIIYIHYLCTIFAFTLRGAESWEIQDPEHMSGEAIDSVQVNDNLETEFPYMDGEVFGKPLPRDDEDLSPGSVH